MKLVAKLYAMFDADGAVPTEFECQKLAQKMFLSPEKGALACRLVNIRVMEAQI